MRKRFIFAFILTILFALYFSFNSNYSKAEDNSSAITSAEMKSPNRYPAYNDTYFTYYSDITGYKSNGYWGFYSKTNRYVNIPPMYSDIEGLDSNYIKVKRGGLWGLINTNGDQILQPNYSEIKTFYFGNRDFFEVKSNGYWGIVDSNGVQIVPTQYQYISRLNDSYLSVKQNNQYGVYSVYEGKEIITTKYDGITMLEPWIMAKQNGGWGLIDAEENVIVPFKYDDIKKLNSSYFAVKNYKSWGTVSSKTGEEVIAPKYDKIEYGRLNYLKVKLNGKWGAVDYTGKLVVPIVKGPFEINKVLKTL